MPHFSDINVLENLVIMWRLDKNVHEGFSYHFIVLGTFLSEKGERKVFAMTI